MLGYTQAFSSLGGLLVSGVYLLINQNAHSFPAIYESHAQRGDTRLISAVIPAVPLIVDSAVPARSRPSERAKRAAGTLQAARVSVSLFQPMLLRTTVVTAALFACSFRRGLRAPLQMTPQMVPGLVPSSRLPWCPNGPKYEAAKIARDRRKDHRKLDELKALGRGDEAAEAEAEPDNGTAQACVQSWHSAATEEPSERAMTNRSWKS